MKDSPSLAAAPDDTLATYNRVAEAYARSRDRTLFERRWLDRALNYAPGRKVLDLGCGTGLPIASYLADRRCAITGVDGAPAMLERFRRNLPRARALEADMRGLRLDEPFDLILAWNSFFHLAPEDQRAMFETFWAHARARTVLLFTTGPEAGEVIGHAGGEPVYHASLAPDEYRGLLASHGFDVIAFTAEDPDCNGHSVWLARYAGAG